MLEVHQLSKRYGPFLVLRDVSFAVRPGEVLGYLGPNGSGKSTTVKMLTGLLEPTSGRIVFEGRDVAGDLLAYKARVGYVPEEPQLYPFLTGPEFLRLVGGLRAMPPATLERRIDRLLDLWGLTSDRYVPLSGFSKGMRQKVLLSAALLHDPDVVILDEPDSGLDVSSTLVLRHLVAGLAAAGKIVLYSSHVLEAVEKMCSSVVILHEGRVVAYDAVDRLRSLMALPSLEDVFSRLVVGDDLATRAQGMLEAMRLDASATAS
jgi:ABC-2 type transport system ATP-binding protein